jgi:hypothetical protein
LDILQNEHGESRKQANKYDSSVQVFNALALKGLSKFAVADLQVTFGELTTSFIEMLTKYFLRVAIPLLGLLRVLTESK